MFDKKMAKQLEGMLNQIDQSKLEQLKGMLNNEGDLSNLISNINAQKANDALKQLNLEEVTKNVNISGVVNELKRNPDVLNEIKKML